jgi:hypothetical protein
MDDNIQLFGKIKSVKLTDNEEAERLDQRLCRPLH